MVLLLAFLLLVAIIVAPVIGLVLLDRHTAHSDEYGIEG